MKTILLALLCTFASFAQCTTTTLWNGISWSNGAPTETVNAIIDANYTVSVTAPQTSFKCCTLTINVGATLTINNNRFVSVVNGINTIGTFVVKSGGRLVQVNDDAVNTGDVTVERITSPYQQYDYIYFSSPVITYMIQCLPGTQWLYKYQFSTWMFTDQVTINNQGVVTANVPDGFDDDFTADVNDNAWNQMADNSLMLEGKGYIAMSQPSIGVFPRVSTAQFTGSLRNGIIKPYIQASEDLTSDTDDWNLLGNPYPCAINADLFIIQNTPAINGTLYFWTHIDDISASNPGLSHLNFSARDYAMYNLTGGIQAMSGGSLPTSDLPSCQGFFVEADTFGYSVEFNNTMRDEGYNNNNFYRVADDHKYRLNLTTTNTFSQCLIGYGDQSTLGFDKMYDGPAMVMRNGVNLYTTIDNKRYRIESRGAFDNTDVVKLTYVSDVQGVHTIELIETGFTSNVYLNDRLLNVQHDLSTPYSFSSEVGTYADRFEIVYIPNQLSTIDRTLATNYIHYNSSNQTIDVNYSVSSNIELYDINGRQIKVRTSFSNGITSIDASTLSDSMYIVVVDNIPMKVIKN